jgi:hypothetical protein
MFPKGSEDAMPRRSARFRFEPPIYTFRVRILDGLYAPSKSRDVWREIEIAANQPLGDLAEAIQAAFEFDEAHMWAFFLSGKAWDASTEYGMALPFGDPPPNDALKSLIRDLPQTCLTGKREFLFLFDFGDGWEFGVKHVRTSQDLHPTERYPRITNRHGEAPPQYPDMDEWEDDEDEYEDEADGTPNAER